MEVKKSKGANLESKRILFLQIGLVVSLCFTLAAFEWTMEKSYSMDKLFSNTRYEIEEIVKITVQEDTKPIIPVPKVQPVNFSVIDNEKAEDIIEIDFTDPEDTENSLDLIKIDEPEDEPEDNGFFTVVEEQPSFPGGYAALLKYIKDHLDYPQTAREIGLAGTVYVSFIVWKDGSIRNVVLQRGIGGGCDEAALHVIENMPSWIPGKQRTVPVNVQMVLPVKFQLN
ncbi:MAG: TonB family protein [Bacteroidetes bacterium]|nr:TonB family protein [Bacteroidota bacterium]